MTPAVREVLATDVPALVAGLNDISVEELNALDHGGPGVVLQNSVDASAYVRSIVFDDTVAAIWGLRVLGASTGLGAPWLMTAATVREHPRVLLRMSRIELAIMREITPRMVAMVYAKYEAAVRWFKWLGFVLDGPHPFGVKQLPWWRGTLEN